MRNDEKLTYTTFDHPRMEEGWRIQTPKTSDWVCYLFGSPGGWGMYYRPLKGGEPNWFWRKMQFLVLGHRWVKEPQK
jgi:hypothetical protein